MILQALRSELLKMAKNRWSTFWAYAFAPLLTLVMGIVFQMFVRVPQGAEMFNVATPISSVRDGLGSYGNLFLQIFPIAGAAILFAGEYRWETWRAILTRNGRMSIMLAKMIAFMLAAALSILACGLAGLLIGLYDVTQSASVVWPNTNSGNVALSLALALAAAFLQLMATAGLVMLIAVFSRAIIAAIVGPFIVLTVAEIASIRFRLPDLADWGALFPNLAASALQQVSHDMLGAAPNTIEEMARVSFGTAAANAHEIAGLGAAALVLWALLLSAAALFRFQRQDMSKE
jgi:ABC-2 type transport system permease protein